MKKHSIEVATLVFAAVFCAIVSNAVASRERKLVLPGFYPNATTVPGRTDESPAPMTTTVAMSPSPGNPPMTITTTETAPATATVPATTTAAPLVPPTATATTTAAVPPTPAPATTTAPAPPAAAGRPATSEDLLTRFPPHESKPYVEIHGDDVAWLYQRGVLFLDARRTSIYEQGHIAGSRSFSVWESDVDAKVAALFEERSDPQQQLQPIVIYCSGGDCEDSHMLAQKLWGLQFNNVYVYKDGYPDWLKRNGATRTGATP